MARVSKPEAATDEHADKSAPRTPEPVPAERAPEAAPEMARMPEAAASPTAIEVQATAPTVDDVPTESPAPASPVEPPPEPVVVTVEAVMEAVEPAAPGDPGLPAPTDLARAADPATTLAAPTLRQLQRLHGITLGFWQDHLGRTMATGQAILSCRSPQAAIGLQIGYLQATLASGVEHAGEVARLSQDMARDMLPGR